MKKTVFVFMLVLSAMALFAQKAPEPVTVSGKLALSNGHIAVQSGDTTYYVMGLQRLIGFVDGLKEGAQVSLEGFIREIKNSNAKVMHASKLTIAGKTYDLAPAHAAGFAGNPPERRTPPEPKMMHHNKPGPGVSSCHCGKPGERHGHDRNPPKAAPHHGRNR